MELRELIETTHGLRENLKHILAQEISIKDQIRVLEEEIKAKLDETGDDYENLTEEEFQLLMVELSDPKKLTVEVVYAANDNQVISEIQLARGATIEDAIILSGILEKCKDIDLTLNKVGLYGVIKPLTETLSHGDRIEIYRPITAKA